MNKLKRWSEWWELVFLLLIVGGVFLSIPLSLGRLGLSWDTLNHQVYLGWQAESPRFDRDYMAASLQSYQYPYLYWPLYALTRTGVSGEQAGVIMALLHFVLIPPMWGISKTLIPGRGWEPAVLRIAGVIMSFASILILKAFEVPGNDLLSCAPLIYALHMALRHVGRTAIESRSLASYSVMKAASVAGAMAGLSVAFKLSNGFAAVFLPLLLLLGPQGARFIERVKSMVACAAGMAIGFVLSYGYWGYLLYKEFGSPLFPFWGG